MCSKHWLLSDNSLPLLDNSGCNKTQIFVDDRNRLERFLTCLFMFLPPVRMLTILVTISCLKTTKTPPEVVVLYVTVEALLHGSDHV